MPLAAPLKYLHAYPEHLVRPVRELLADGRLGPLLLGKYPQAHPVRNDGALAGYRWGIERKRALLSQPAASRTGPVKVQTMCAKGVISEKGGKHRALARARCF